jgi:hypothetical protein
MSDQLARLIAVATVLGTLAGCADRWAEPPQPRAAEPAVPPRERPPPIGRPIELGLPSQGEEAAEPLEPVVERGTGSFVAPPSPPVRASLTTDAAGEITLNVVDAELREVVRLVLQDALGVNYVIDPAVGGRITVQTMRPLPPSSVNVYGIGGGIVPRHAEQLQSVYGGGRGAAPFSYDASASAMLVHGPASRVSGKATRGSRARLDAATKLSEVRAAAQKRRLALEGLRWLDG